MALGLDTNLAAMSAQRLLAQTQTGLESAFARLSSGLRLTSAAADAAGLAIADQLDQTAAVDTQAASNVSVGLGALQVADQALGQIGDVNTRLSALAAESANGLLTDAQRGAIQQEFGALTGEIDRIAGATSLGGVQLLQPGSTVALQVGGGSGDQVSFQTVDASAAGLGLAGADVSTQAGAQDALAATAAATDAIARQRAAFGGAGERLAATARALGVGQEQALAAAGRIRDVNVAAETGAAASARILLQTEVTALAHANRQPGLLLSVFA